jgi:predicted nuclease with TOPRIM domain
MTLYKAMSAVKRRELEAEIERLRNLGFDSVDREEKLREQLSEARDAMREIERVDREEIERLRAENARLEKMLEVCSSVHGHNVALKAANAELRAQLKSYLPSERGRWVSALKDELVNEKWAGLKARLEWFTQGFRLQATLLEALIEQNEQAYNWVAFRELSRWRQNNPEPKPGAGT